MENEKNEIIDAILKFMFGNGYKFNTKINDESDLTPIFERNLFRSEWQSLVSENKLIRKFEHSDCVFILTDEGKKAAEIGIVKYLDEIEREKQLDLKSKIASINSVRLSKYAIAVSILAVIASFTVPFFVVNYERRVKHPASENKQIRINESQSMLVIDSALIESVKRDTAFMNQLKKEIIYDDK